MTPSLRRFARHFLEMMVAMAVGMVALPPVWTVATDWLVRPAWFDRPEVAALVMATNMTIGMSAWMAYRRHGLGYIGEMAAAMYVPFVIAFVPLWLGIVGAEAMMTGGHVLMLAAMVAVMLRRKDEDHHSAAEPEASGENHRAA